MRSSLPHTDSPRTVRVVIVVSAEERAQLDKDADERNMSVAEILRCAYFAPKQD